MIRAHRVLPIQDTEIAHNTDFDKRERKAVRARLYTRQGLKKGRWADSVNRLSCFFSFGEAIETETRVLHPPPKDSVEAVSSLYKPQYELNFPASKTTFQMPIFEPEQSLSEPNLHPSKAPPRTI